MLAYMLNMHSTLNMEMVCTWWIYSNLNFHQYSCNNFWPTSAERALSGDLAPADQIIQNEWLPSIVDLSTMFKAFLLILKLHVYPITVCKLLDILITWPDGYWGQSVLWHSKDHLHLTFSKFHQLSGIIMTWIFNFCNSQEESKIMIAWQVLFSLRSKDRHSDNMASPYDFKFL